jgi:hypothetical protein
MFELKSSRQSAERVPLSKAPRLDKGRCACGGTPGADGECAACRARRLAAAGPSTAAHRFDAIGVEPASRPRIAVRRFGLAPAIGGDKSTSEGGHQDQSLSATTYESTTDGAHLDAEGLGLYVSPDFPDGFRWTQTIDTNDPRAGAVSPYVDPHPNDDTKPFYWTDGEEAAHVGSFTDYPARPAPASGVTTWEATLCLNGVNEGTKTTTAFDCIGWGFTRDSAGAVTLSGLTSSPSGAHRSILGGEFPDWTFT